MKIPIVWLGVGLRHYVAFTVVLGRVLRYGKQHYFSNTFTTEALYIFIPDIDRREYNLWFDNNIIMWYFPPSPFPSLGEWNY